MLSFQECVYSHFKAMDIILQINGFLKLKDSFIKMILVKQLGGGNILGHQCTNNQYIINHCYFHLVRVTRQNRALQFIS